MYLHIKWEVVRIWHMFDYTIGYRPTSKEVVAPRPFNQKVQLICRHITIESVSVHLFQYLIVFGIYMYMPELIY